jgi:hypothetical protein
VNVKARVTPGENSLRPFRAEKIPADKKGQDLAGKYIDEPRVVDPGDPMENSRPVYPALGHQKMQMRVEIDAVPEGLDDGDNPGLEDRPGHGL